MPRFVGGGWRWLDLPQVLAAWRIVNIELLVFQDHCPMALSRPDRMASDSNLRADYTPDLIRSHPLLSASESIPKECRAMVGARQTDEGRKVSVRSAMSPFWLGVGCCRNFAFWNPEAETELTVFVLMSAGTDTDTRTTHPGRTGDLPASRDSWPLRFSPVDRKRNSLTLPLTD